MWRVSKYRRFTTKMNALELAELLQSDLTDRRPCSDLSPGRQFNVPAKSLKATPALLKPGLIGRLALDMTPKHFPYLKTASACIILAFVLRCLKPPKQ